MTEKNLALLEEKEREKKIFKIRTLNDFLASNKKYYGLDIRKGISFPKRLKGQKFTPSAQLAVPGDEKDIVSVFKDIYHSAYPFREFEEESEVLKMIEDPNFYWVVFRNGSNAIVGCIGLEIDLENKSGILHGLVFKRQYQGITNLYKLFTASFCSVLRIFKNDILSVSCEVRSAHSTSQYMGKILGFVPVAFLPNKDIFFKKEESEIIVISYYEDALGKYRSPKTAKFPFQVLKSYNYAVQKLGILGPFKVKNYPNLAYKGKKLSKCMESFTSRVDKDKYENEFVEFAYSGSNSFLKFFYNKYISNIERINYSVNSKEELFVFLEKLVQFIRENNIRYCDCFVSAYNALHQIIFLNAGFEAYGYIPAFKYNKMEKNLEDQVVFAYYKGYVDLERLQIIPETKELINNLKPLWKLPIGVKRKVAKDIKIVKDPNEILKLLHMGTNILLWPEFDKYILFDLKYFNAQSLLLTEGGKSLGHALVFSSDQETLFFGFFGVSNDKEDRIKFLIEKLIEFAEKSGFNELRGPINIPTIIYGWGFMEEGSSTSHFVHKPVNLPIYPAVFRQEGFSEILKEYSFEGYFGQLPPEFLEGLDFSDYELVVFDSWDEIEATKIEFLKLNIRNLPPKSVVTPVSGPIFDNYFSFIKQYGDPSMMVFAKFKKTNKLIGCFIGTPDPFSKNSFVLLTIVLDKKHRDKGLSWWMIKELFANSLKHGINYCTTFVGSHVDSTKFLCKKFGLPLERTHTIFTYQIKNKS